MPSSSLQRQCVNTQSKTDKNETLEKEVRLARVFQEETLKLSRLQMWWQDTYRLIWTGSGA